MALIFLTLMLAVFMKDHFCLITDWFVLFLSTDKSAFYNSWVTSKDIAVEGFLLLKTKVTSKIQCGLKCSQHKTCLSFSMQYTRSPGKRICELNTVSAKSHPQSIVKRIGFQYYERVQIFF